MAFQCFDRSLTLKTQKKSFAELLTFESLEHFQVKSYILIEVWKSNNLTISATQKMKFSIRDSFSKCYQIRRKLRIWSHLLKKSLMENFIFCAVHYVVCRAQLNNSENKLRQEMHEILIVIMARDIFFYIYLSICYIFRLSKNSFEWFTYQCKNTSILRKDK